MNKKPEYLTSKQVCAWAGVKPRTLRQWITEGLPVAGSAASRGKEGRPQNKFNKSVLNSWCGEHGKNLPGVVGRFLAEAYKDIELPELKT